MRAAKVRHDVQERALTRKGENAEIEEHAGEEMEPRFDELVQVPIAVDMKEVA